MSQSKAKSKDKAKNTNSIDVRKETAKLNKNINFRLCNSRTGESFLLKVGRDKKLIIYDKEEGRNRVIRHATNEQSIYLDEQTSHANVESIEFQYGRLTVKPTETITLEFLRAHPDLGRVFEEEDEEKEAVADIEREELIHDIKAKIRENASAGEEGIITLERLVSILTGSIAEAQSMDVPALKRRLYVEASTNPSFFTGEDNKITVFDDSYLQTKYIVMTAENDGIIKINKSHYNVTWSNGEEIIQVARGKDIIDEFTSFLISEENQLTLNELVGRL